MALPTRNEPSDRTKADLQAEQRSPTDSAGNIRDMFDAIAPRYDLLNHLLSGGLDILWRRRAAKIACTRAGDDARVRADDDSGDNRDNNRTADDETMQLAVDLCCGTGDLAAAIAKLLNRRHAKKLRRRNRRKHQNPPAVIGLDFSQPMISRARQKYARLKNLNFIIADALAPGLPDGAADLVTCAFGLRNVGNVPLFIQQATRLLRCGGKLVIIDFFRPGAGLRQALFGFYFRRIVPIVGRQISGHRSAYSYLPASADSFIAAHELADEMQLAELGNIKVRPLPGGAATIVSGEKCGGDVEGGSS